jgi:hemerythrin
MASHINNHDERFSLGLPEMDEQHTYLYSLFDRLEQSDKVTNNKSTALLLAEIERYLLFHFESEEQLMRRYGFAGFAQHQSDHETAGAKLVQFMNDFIGGCLNPAALRTFLTGWLMEHSRISDSAYAEWVQECRKKVEEAISK